MDYTRVKLGMYDDARKLQNEDEELLIFGYSCKLFRDDEKAGSFENGEHLIPWMGDSTLMIDRFDVRGALYDLREAECNGKHPEEPLTEVEMKEEEICEQERYLALYHDETQHQFACEEETKRLEVELASDGSFYNQVGFNYTVPTHAEANHNNPVVAQDVQTIQPPLPEPVAYMPLSDEDAFIPPQEMIIPLGMEVPKTVKQNKIIIKTAKFIVAQGAQMEIIIKTKQAGNPMFNFLAFDNALNAYYKHVVGLIRNGRYRCDDESDGLSGKGDQSDQYLHPNLSQSVRPDLTPGVASSPSRPSPHCAYTKLITKIREKQKASTIEDSEIASPVLPSSPLHPSTVAASPKEAGQTPVRRLSSEPVVGLVDYPSFNQTADGNSDGEEIDPVFTKKFTKAPPVHDYRNIKWPPREMQMVIDKMASYIIKNGNAFEEVVRNRGDSRFEFLVDTHEYHPYYKCKIQLYSEVYGDIFKSTSKTHEWRRKSHGNVPNKKISSDALKNNSSGSRTISFSIKSREQEVSLTSHTTFPIESSTSEEDEDMDEEEKEKRRAERLQRRQARRHKEEKERKEREEFLKKERMRKEREREEEERRERKNGDEDSSGNEDLYDIFKYAQEMERDSEPKPRPESPEEANSKQEQRKKKAAAFLSKLKDSKEEKKPVIYGPEIPPEIAAGLLRSVPQSPSSSTASSVSSEEEKPPLPPPPTESCQPPPPPPRSPSPPDIPDGLFTDFTLEKSNKCSVRETSSSPKRSKASIEDSISMASVMLSGLNEAAVKKSRKRVSEVRETHSRKSRSHKKHSRQKSESWSPSTSRKERKKRKRSRGSSHRRKKRRSRSRSRSRGRSKAHRSSHKKKQSKHSSHREKDKSRKKKHKRHRSPSSVSSLPSSESSSPSTPSTLPSESESDMEVQVIESDDIKKSSRGSSIVSLPSTSSVFRTSEFKKITMKAIAEVEDKVLQKEDASPSGGEENSLSSIPPVIPKYSRPLFPPPVENSSSSDCTHDTEKKSLFNPNTSSAMAKIAQGLRAKLNAMLEKEKLG